MSTEGGASQLQLGAGATLTRPGLSDVARGYRLLLGRDLESTSSAAALIARSPDLWHLIEALYGSYEARNRRISDSFREARAGHESRPQTASAPIELLDELYNKTLGTWRKRGLGQYHHALCHGRQRYAEGSEHWNVELVLAEGREEAAGLLKTLERHAWRVQPGLVLTVIGVEAFRMVGAAADNDLRLVAFELLERDVARAAKVKGSNGTANSRLYHIGKTRDGVPSTDLFYSVASLQFLPPPLIVDILQRCLRAVKPGGVAVFQVPANLHDYGAGTETGQSAETGGALYCVHQADILELLFAEGFQLLEVIPDECISIFGVSYFYVAKKSAPLPPMPIFLQSDRILGKMEKNVSQALSEATLMQSVEAREWFHRIDLGDGVVTPGSDDTPYKLTALGLPDSLAGKTVLDIGAWDGFFSFECERRGADRVVASDFYCWNGGGIQDGGGFRLAHDALHSRVERLDASVETLDPAIHGTFDFVLFLGVLYHARDPLGYLAKTRALCRGTAIIETWVDGLEIEKPALIFYPGVALNNDASNYFGPNEAAVISMCKEVGFRDVEVVNRHYYPNRMVFHAHV